MKFKFAVIFLLAIGLSVQAKEFTKVATSSAQFLKLGAGARATAMGDAFTALANDASALYWNPAGIQKIGHPSLSLSRTYLYAGITYNFIGVVVPVDGMTTVGVSAIHLSSGEIERTTVDMPEGTGDTFDTGHTAIGLSVSRRLTNRFDLGVTIKYINERLFREEATTMAFDIGSQFDTGIYGIKIGMSLSNFGGKMKFDGPDLDLREDNDLTGISYRAGGRWKTADWPIPLVFRLGAMVDIIGGDSPFMQDETNRLTIAIEGNDPVDNVLRYNLGAEYIWNDIFALRAGYKFQYDEADWTAGMGFNLNKIGINARLDYSFNSYGILGYVHNYTFEFNF